MAEVTSPASKVSVEQAEHDTEDLQCSCKENDRLRAALASIGEYDCISGDYRHCPGCPVCDANKALGPAVSAPQPRETSARTGTDADYGGDGLGIDRSPL